MGYVPALKFCSKLLALVPVQFPLDEADDVNGGVQFVMLVEDLLAHLLWQDVLKFGHDVALAHAVAVPEDKFVEPIESCSQVFGSENSREILDGGPTGILHNFITSFVVQKELAPELKAIAINVSGHGDATRVQFLQRVQHVAELPS